MPIGEDLAEVAQQPNFSDYRNEFPVKAIKIR